MHLVPGPIAFIAVTSVVLAEVALPTGRDCFLAPNFIEEWVSRKHSRADSIAREKKGGLKCKAALAIAGIGAAIPD
jgi:hypothetical protein